MLLIDRVCCQRESNIIDSTPGVTLAFISRPHKPIFSQKLLVGMVFCKAQTMGVMP
jgi:hypothetical protein